MNVFLRQVAEFYLDAGVSASGAEGLGHCCFVFPNRRSQIFFGKYLGEGVKQAGRPVLAPRMTTVRDFIAKTAGGRLADRVDQLLELYACWSELSGGADTLDEFIFWGDVLLEDFDDVDKYRVDPAQLFRNVSEFRELQDTFSYLSEAQREALEHFIGHFLPDGAGKEAADRPEVKEKFLRTWNLLLPLYRNFRSRLEEKELAYEGMLYRALADRLKQEPAADVMAEAFPGTDKFIFTGLNALNECEKIVLGKLRDASLADFCWDYSGDLIRDPVNRSSFFLSQNVQDFPQRFPLDAGGTGIPEVEVVSVPSSVGQAKLLWDILKDEEYAVVLPDERLLLPVLNSVPPAIRDINVTMGYPMGASAFFDFLNLVMAMQLHLRKGAGGWLFYHSQVWSLFASSLFRKVTEGDEAAADRIKQVKQGMQYYIPAGELSGIPFLDLLFRPVVTDPKAASKEQTAALCAYLKALIEGLAVRLKDDPDMALELEFAKKAYQAVNRLEDKRLEVLPLTFSRLLDRLLRPLSVPFNGEPLKGLQIMGPLETRALDFRNLVILSCNEGIFPHRSVQSSFIPPELRRGFGLPTYEYQDAVWAYYFYRLLQRAEKVWLVYDARTEGIQTGEESRYIKQLEYHFRLPLTRKFLKAQAHARMDSPDIPKTAEHLQRLAEARFSASALKNYLDCPAMFFFSRIEGLKEEDEVAEDLDAGMFGSVYHATMQALFLGPAAMDPACRQDSFPETADALREVTQADLKGWLGRERDIKARVRSLILEQLRAREVSGRNLVLENVIVQYVLKTLRRDLELLRQEGVDRFRIAGLERNVSMTFDGFRFVGVIDRLDSFRPGELRIVDYKTGKVSDNDLDIRDDNAEEVVQLLFGTDNQKRPKIAFQLFLYDLLVRQIPAAEGMTLVHSVYQPVKLFTEPVHNFPVSGIFNTRVEEELRKVLHEIADASQPWRRTDDPATCSWCSFKMICGR